MLGALAEHEGRLLAKLESAKAEAREIVDRARAEARKVLQAEESRLIEDTGRIRRDAESKREAEFEATVSAAEARLAGVRSEAEGRVEEVARRVLKLIMPDEGRAS